MAMNLPDRYEQQEWFPRVLHNTLTVVICKECSAVVSDTNAHDLWHTRIDGIDRRSRFSTERIG